MSMMNTGSTPGHQPQPEPSIAASVMKFTKFMSDAVGRRDPVITSLSKAAELPLNSKVIKALTAIVERVEGGDSLSEAMNAHEDIFDQGYRSMVAAGEIGGILDIAFQRINERLVLNEKIAKDPCVPYTKPEIRRFASDLGSFVTMGVPILSAIQMAAVGHRPELVEAITAIHDAIREGDSMIAPMMRRPEIFDAAILHVVHIGEETGDLDTGLLNFAWVTKA